MAEENVTVIDAQADFEGKLRGKDALVRGRFKGEIEISGRLQLGEGSRVEATIKADAAEISGELKGDVKARSLILEKNRSQGLSFLLESLEEGVGIQPTLALQAQGPPGQVGAFHPGKAVLERSRVQRLHHGPKTTLEGLIPLQYRKP